MFLGFLMGVVWVGIYRAADGSLAAEQASEAEAIVRELLPTLEGDLHAAAWNWCEWRDATRE